MASAGRKAMAMGLGGGIRAATLAAKRATVHLQAYAPLASVVNAQIKAKETTSSSSNFGKLIGITDPPSSDLPKLISKFIKLNNPLRPGMRKNCHVEEKLRNLLAGKDRIGMPEIAKMLSQDFVKG